MRILQIIDSLNVGGAEKMAVNYANTLARIEEFSGIVVTRKEGVLKSQINDNVGYLFLKRKRKIDIGALKRLKKYCIENNIDHVQAHSLSYFTSLLLKLIYPKVKIIWHDHYGLSEFLSKRKLFYLKIASLYFKGIIAVNTQLERWANNKLNCKNVIYLPNYTSVDSSVEAATMLFGNKGKRIVSVANLRYQKNHYLLLEVAEKLMKSHPDWSFHLIGNDLNDEYSKNIKKLIKTKSLENNVFIYGTRNDTTNIINQAEITILTSDSEGLPVALIEYGLLKKPTVATNVGEIPLIINNGENGFVVPIKDSDNFYNSLLQLVESSSLRVEFGEKLYQTIYNNNSEEAVIKQYLNWVKSL